MTLITTTQEGFEPQPFPTFVDSTTRANFMACPRLFFLQYHQGYRHASANINLTAGGAIAKGLEIARKARYIDFESPADSEMRGINALMANYAGAAGSALEDFSENAKSLDRCIEAFEKYFKNFGWDSDHIQPYEVNSAPAVECSFAIPLEVLHPVSQDPIVYTGRYDMLGVYNDQIFVVDEKTTKQLGPTWSNNWILRSQLTGYCWAARAYGHEVAGAIIRGICFTKEIKFAESIQYRDSWEIDRWYEQLNLDVERMIQCWKRDYWDYNLDTACANYGGCTYADICKTPNAKKWLDSDFTIVHWDPLSKD